MSHPSFITLLTDFGSRDAFVASMKGVILTIDPQSRIVDLSHEIRPQNIREASYVLQSSYRYFPKGTIHLVVVDPGVGSDRRPILVKGNHYFFVAPDNGVLSGIYEEQAPYQVFEITESDYFLKKEGSTFHGRDRFAPVAAGLAKGSPPEQFGKPIIDFVRFPIPKPRRLKDGGLTGQVIYIDRFGNLITNITRDHLGPWLSQSKTLEIHLKERSIKGLKDFYARGGTSELCALINSDERLEIFCYREDANSQIGASDDEPVVIR
jgi:S-adenosyl-L-methionine hydrolase (adenosine-forming)